MMLFSITGTTEVFSFIASSGIRLLCFFCKYSQKSHLCSKAFQRKTARHKEKKKTEVWREKKKKGRRVQIGMRYRGEAKRKMAVVE